MSTAEYNIDEHIFTIDDARLDIEWSKLPQESFGLATLAAKARMVQDESKREYDVRYAEADIAVRRDPAKYGFNAKPTEDAIKAIINAGQVVFQVGKQLAQIQDEMRTAQYRYSVCMAGVNAINAKKDALDNITKLKSINYHSSR